MHNEYNFANNYIFIEFSSRIKMCMCMDLYERPIRVTVILDCSSQLLCRVEVFQLLQHIPSDSSHL